MRNGKYECMGATLKGELKRLVFSSGFFLGRLSS